MFDTATTAFYHTNSQPARGLFSNITLPSSLPSQLLQNSFVMFPLGLFSQQQQSSVTTTPNIQTHTTDRTVTSAATSASQISAPAPPLPPLSTANRRQSRRNKNGSSATTAQITGNMNVQQSNLTVAHHNSGHNHHGGQRRKKLSNKINRKLIDQSITFSAIAVEEDQQGNHQCALDLYLTALESMLYAMPIHSDMNRKEAMKDKLREFIDHVGLADEFIQPQPVSDTKSQPRHQPSSHAPISSYADGTSPTSKQVVVPTTPISQHIIKGAITTAVALKQSPIPDAISATVNYTMKKVKQIDETYGLQEKAWEISRSGINLALEIDQQYNVHEKVGNALFTGLAAAMKAGIAYKDSPSYQELKRMKAEYSKH